MGGGRMSENADPLFDGPGDVRRLCRSMDWSSTPLGPTRSWSALLRGTVQMAMRSSFPMVVHWGPELVAIYNDAFAVLIGGRHPAALGAGMRDTWPERWDGVGTRLDKVILDGVTIDAEDEQRILYRNGYPEECYFSYSHSPIDDVDGAHRRACSPSPPRRPRRCCTSGGCGWSGSWARCRSPTPAARRRPAGRCCGCWPRRGRRCRSRSRSCGEDGGPVREGRGLRACARTPASRG